MNGDKNSNAASSDHSENAEFSDSDRRIMERERVAEKERVKRAQQLEQSADWVKHSTIGLQFAGSMAGFVLGGVWLDSKLGTSPWLLLAGAVFGFGGSFVWLYYQVFGTEKAKSSSSDQKK